jgi:hypothetical protein
MIPESCFDNTALIGETRRFTHDCTTKIDKRLVVTRTEKGFKWYCHGCPEHGVKLTDSLSPEEWLVRNKKSEVEVLRDSTKDGKIYLPKDFTTNIPPQGLAWLWEFELTDLEIKTHNIGYSPLLNRVILPVYHDDKLVYWQGRNIGKITPKNPKYINISESGRKGIYFKIAPHKSKNVVLVEDIISTIKVGRVTDCYGLLYAYIPDDLVLKLAVTYDTIILWLDWDKLTRMVSRVNRYRAFGLNVKKVATLQDPKAYDTARIREELEV